MGIGIGRDFRKPESKAPKIRRSIAAPRAALVQEGDGLEQAGNSGEGARAEQLCLRALPAT
jgi:hypothetical protein